MSDIPSELLLPPPRDQFDRDLLNAINDIIRKIADAVNVNFIAPTSGGYYIGDTKTDGSWRIVLSGSNLVRQRLESGSWVTKGSDTP